MVRPKFLNLRMRTLRNNSLMTSSPTMMLTRAINRTRSVAARLVPAVMIVRRRRARKLVVVITRFQARTIRRSRRRRIQRTQVVVTLATATLAHRAQMAALRSPRLSTVRPFRRTFQVMRTKRSIIFRISSQMRRKRAGPIHKLLAITYHRPFLNAKVNPAPKLPNRLCYLLAKFVSNHQASVVASP